MTQNFKVGKKKPLNISLVLLSVLLACVKVENSRKALWQYSNLTRTLATQDYFEFWSNIGKSKCSLGLSKTICEDYGGIPLVTDCKELCCQRCMCLKNKPTFLGQKLHCVEDRNITGTSGSNQFVLTTEAGILCNTTRLPLLDVSTAGSQNFLICENGINAPMDVVEQCSVDTNRYPTIHAWNASERVKASFQVMKKGEKLLLKWSAGLQWLQGHIVSIPVNCKMVIFINPRNSDVYTIQSRIYFKVPGSQTGLGPKVFYQMAPVLSTPTIVTSPNVTSAFVMTTPSDSTTSDHNSKLNIIHVPGKVDLVLVILAALLGSLLFLIIGAAIIAAFIILRRKKKLNISGKKSTSNPTYERGPDQSLINGGTHQSSYKVSNSFYQPLVENTRTVPRNGKDPIYESLDDNLRENKMTLTENPNRCSLAYCDVTSDGYLIPTGDEHTPPEPPSRLPSLPNSQHSRPRLSSSYDEPEVVIVDRKPKQNTQNSNSDNKPTYQVLEEDSKECDGDVVECVNLEPENETVSDKNKSPTENSYLELLGDEGEAKHPLESETL